MEAQALHNMNEVAAALLKTPGEPADLTSTLRHIAQTAHDAFGTDVCVIIAFNPITSKFIGSQTVGRLVQGENELLHKKPRPKGVTQQVLRDGMLLIEDADTKPQYHNRFTRKAGVRAFAGIAMLTRHRKKPLGVIYLDFKQPRTFSPTDRESFQNFAVQASFLLQETWLARHYEQVARIGQAVNHNLDTIDNLFQVLQTYVDEVLDETHTLVLAVSQPQTQWLDTHLREYGQTILMNMLVQGACQHVIKTQETWFIQQLSKEAAHLPFQVINIIGTEQKESLIFVPLLLRGVSLGVLSIQHALPNAYGQEDLFILQLLASYAALGLHNIRLYSSLSQLNETGQLLTQQLESEHALQMIVEQIHEATKADLVILYPYEPMLQCFASPAHRAGTLLNTPFPQTMFPRRPNDIAALVLHHPEPIFAKESASIYTELHSHIQVWQGNFHGREQIRSTAALPLRVGDESVGVLFVNFRQLQRFDATQKLFIEGLANYAAIAIKNAQVFGMLSQRRVRELEILQHIDRELNRSLELEPVLNTLLKLANEQVHAEEASILLYNSRIQALEMPAALGPHAKTRRTLIIPLHEAKGITRWVLEHKTPARVKNVHRDPQWQDLYIPVSAETVSELDVPLLDGEEVVGVLNFESTREGAFRQEDEGFLVTLAGQAVLAIKNAQAYGRERRLVAEGKVLNQISKEITSQLDPVRVFDLILEKALELTHSTVGSLHLYDADRNDLWIATECGVAEDRKGMRQSLDQGIVGYAARNKQWLNVDVSQPPWKAIYLDVFSGACSELAVPMLGGNELHGVLNIESSTPHHFSESDEHLVQGLADLAVVALQNAERYEKAEREAQRFALLYQAGQELSKITELTQLEQAYQVILDLIEQHGKCQVIIRRYDEEVQELVLVCASQYQEQPPFPRMKLDEGLTGYAARKRRTMVIHDTSNPPLDVPLKLSDPAIQTFASIPIMLKEYYYGNLALSHKEVGYFRGTDIKFFEGLAQQLASTIYRLEMVQTRQEFEQRALSAEEMSSIGQSAFEVMHRLGNDLGLVESYAADIQSELETQGVASTFISRKLENIVQTVQDVLSFSLDLRQELAKLRAKEETAGEPMIMSPKMLLEEAQAFPSLPSNIHICLEIEEDVATIQVIHSLVSDILRNLVANAIQAMPKGGTITLRGRNAGRSVALEVSDTGVGISAEKLSKIFDLFFSTKGSSGFGLWSARRNALRNYGNLKVESKVGQGTTFTLILPRIDEGEGVS